MLVVGDDVPERYDKKKVFIRPTSEWRKEQNQYQFAISLKNWHGIPWRHSKFRWHLYWIEWSHKEDPLAFATLQSLQEYGGPTIHQLERARASEIALLSISGISRAFWQQQFYGIYREKD